ncbi:hypothetical protein AF72_07450 [Xylella taiwanensis]|uniref:Uncharacterized protein n=1 Tax=Xylella taiwanensis TaxID=1444770 RepID=Z9JK66_9GAMM|nr:hypothetical protein AF72_07450 [Xylella taiwanensis]
MSPDVDGGRNGFRWAWVSSLYKMRTNQKKVLAQPGYLVLRPASVMAMRSQPSHWWLVASVLFYGACDWHIRTICNDMAGLLKGRVGRTLGWEMCGDALAGTLAIV